jgi:hypothetical protein
MLKNFVKTAWRNLITNKAFSVLNIFGLAAGMAVALLIGLWVYNQYSYDRWLPGYGQVYQVQLNATNNGEISTFNSTSLALADGLRAGIPETLPERRPGRRQLPATFRLPPTGRNGRTGIERPLFHRAYGINRQSFVRGKGGAGKTGPLR